MRLVTHQRGMTLVEVMVGMSIAILLAVSAAPYFADYTANSRLREGGTLLYTEALAAQSEAVKRNTTVRLSVDGNTIQVIDRSNPAAPVTLRERRFSENVTAAGTAIDFVAEGRTVDFADGSMDISMTGVTCGDDYRCPGLRVDGGGGIRVCGNRLATGC